MLHWSNRRNICCFLDNNQYQLPGTYECIAGVGVSRYVQAEAGTALERLNTFLDVGADWCFGHIGYDIKNEIESLSSAHPDYIGFPDLFFFNPEVVLILSDKELTVGAFDVHEQIWEEICTIKVAVVEPSAANIQHRLSRAEYLQRVNQLKQHIVRGDCYEINFCQEFYCNNATIAEVHLYEALCEESPNPYACFYKIDHRYLLCASPERYIQRKGSTIVSQPIKGTIPRQTEVIADNAAKVALQHNAKEQSENVMVVDLVRNDLSKICKEGSVEVSELFGIYSFPQVHQMVSTVRGELKEGIGMADIFRGSFPMASMTGVPKKRVMELIEQYEPIKRGLYSGTVGYISPEGNFDFNVVIRSIQYNAQSKYLSFQTGSAITFNSAPEAEYEECLVKAAHIKKVLNHSTLDD